MGVGTNDTPTSGEWSPTNNDGTSNMVEVESYQYDGGGVGDGNLTQVTDYPGCARPHAADHPGLHRWRRDGWLERYHWLCVQLGGDDQPDGLPQRDRVSRPDHRRRAVRRKRRAPSMLGETVTITCAGPNSDGTCCQIRTVGIWTSSRPFCRILGIPEHSRRMESLAPVTEPTWLLPCTCLLFSGSTRVRERSRPRGSPCRTPGGGNFGPLVRPAGRFRSGRYNLGFLHSALQTD